MLALYSLQCQEEEERRLGDSISCGKTAVETLRLFTCQKEMEAFLDSEQARFWAEAGHPFNPLTAEECRCQLTKDLLEDYCFSFVIFSLKRCKKVPK